MLVLQSFFLSCEKFIEPFIEGNRIHLEQVMLVDNAHEFYALKSDYLLLHPKGIDVSPDGNLMVCSPSGHNVCIYNNEGNKMRPSISVASKNGSAGGGNPTAIVCNTNPDFVLSNGQQAKYICAGTDGIICGWNEICADSTLIIKNNSKTSSYTGITMAVNGGNSYLYAANFRTGRIEVWDKHFNRAFISFTDPQLPSQYSAFNIKCIDNLLYVVYAVKGKDEKVQHDIGNGMINIFYTDGKLFKRFASRGLLNAPWGITMIPESFFDNHHSIIDKKNIVEYNSYTQQKNKNILLFGNSGDGNILMYQTNGKFLGELKNQVLPVTIEGLWALEFVHQEQTGDKSGRLYFTAGSEKGKTGLLGYIQKQ